MDYMQIVIPTKAFISILRFSNVTNLAYLLKADNFPLAVSQMVVI